MVKMRSSEHCISVSALHCGIHKAPALSSSHIQVPTKCQHLSCTVIVVSTYALSSLCQCMHCSSCVNIYTVLAVLTPCTVLAVSTHALSVKSVSTYELSYVSTHALSSCLCQHVHYPACVNTCTFLSGSTHA